MNRKGGRGPGGLFTEVPPISYVWRTPVRRPKPADWDIPDEKAPKRLTPSMRAKLQRIVKRAPEVMVKITGRTKSVDHLKSHLDYITRNGELTGETEQGALLAGRVGLKDLQQRWADDAALDNSRRRDGSLSVNVILSMPAGTDEVVVKDAARAFAIETFGGNHDFVFVQHLEDKHPHVHLTVRSLGYNGRRLNPRKADLQVWRERFAGELRLRGIDAEATPRRTRGRVRKADRGAVLALRRRGVLHPVDRRAREEALREAREGKSGARSWEEKIQSRQQAIRRTYLRVAEELEGAGPASDKVLARELREFVREMPAIETRRHVLMSELAEFVKNRQRDADRKENFEGRNNSREGDQER
ncbi:MAG: type VI secretion protein [Alphaproteobacteria bacterium]|nr:type VI secretion protein [Alphaproteobacteria bacterium]